jgi:hypothetical protein
LRKLVSMRQEDANVWLRQRFAARIGLARPVQ